MHCIRLHTTDEGHAQQALRVLVNRGSSDRFITQGGSKYKLKLITLVACSHWPASAIASALAAHNSARYIAVLLAGESSPKYSWQLLLSIADIADLASPDQYTDKRGILASKQWA